MIYDRHAMEIYTPTPQTWLKYIKLFFMIHWICLLYTSDAADDMQCVDLGGRRIIKKECCKDVSVRVMADASGSSGFFQAEDGIRDVERSRGLGDVYKRQL